MFGCVGGSGRSWPCLFIFRARIAAPGGFGLRFCRTCMSDFVGRSDCVPGPSVLQFLQHSSSFSCQNCLESGASTWQTNKGPPADAAEGPIHMQISIDFHSARQSRKPASGSQHLSILLLLLLFFFYTDLPELKHLDKILLKQIHAAATTFILEAVKHNADKSTISFSLEELTFNTERVETFYTTFQKHKKDLELILSSIGRGPAHIKDVSWRLQYQMKNGQLDKVNEPFYLISLNTETGGASEDVDFSCTAEQLQDLVGKLKDAAKSVEKASQV
uniref:COMM domain-containing protein 3 n=1 Tax=Oryzias latipes TaxID=8090 RepID=A0A3P9MJK2_ORYLA